MGFWHLLAAEAFFSSETVYKIFLMFYRENNLSEFLPEASNFQLRYAFFLSV